jgi:hypothetical protein
MKGPTFAVKLANVGDLVGCPTWHNKTTTYPTILSCSLIHFPHTTHNPPNSFMYLILLLPCSLSFMVGT